MRVKVKVTFEWEVTLDPKWYTSRDCDMIAEEKKSFERDEFLFMEAMNSLDENAKSSVEIEELYD
jgi:hypothetical protein